MLAAIRPIGLAAEEAMYAATGKVNTHKGALFAFGIAAAALGRRMARQEQSDWPALSADIRAICAGLEPELGQGNTAGVFVAIVALTVIGILAYAGVVWAERRVLHYIPRAHVVTV